MNLNYLQAQSEIIYFLNKIIQLLIKKILWYYFGQIKLYDFKHYYHRWYLCKEKSVSYDFNTALIVKVVDEQLITYQEMTWLHV